MKSNRGITLISVITYIVVLSIVIGVISMLTKNFYKNTDDLVTTNNTSEQYSKFISYITKDLNSRKCE